MSSSERNILLTVQYDGTAFHGWQRQDNLRTVQGALTAAVESMVHHPVHCQASSRTDAGVHAAAMPVNFQTSKDIPLHGFLRGINALVDPDIAVLDVEEVPPGWNARRAAAAKTYRFQYQLGPSRMPLLTRNAWYVKREDLDLEAMRRASALLIGEHDFSSFRAAGCNAKTTWRRIYDVSFERSPDGNLIIMHITGNAFLRHMVRILAGTLFEVGIGRRSIDGFAEALAAQHRPAAGVTAGPEGLTLVTVHFEGYAKLGPIGQSSNTL